MSKDYSANAFFAFMDYLKEKGLLKANTAQARKAAAKKMLAIADDSERQDLRSINIDELHERFANKSGTGYRPESLQVYKSRFKTAREDFIKYVDNPTSFKPSVAQRDANAKAGVQPRKKSPEMDSGGSRRKPTSSGNIVFPVPLRPDLIVELHNVPSDMTESEAERIASVVKALAQK